MNNRKYEKFKEPNLPSWWSLIIALAFVSIILMLSYKVLQDARSCPKPNSSSHVSNPQIFNE